MPSSQFRPHPSDVQSGWFNDRSGTVDRTVRVDGDMEKSAREENTSGTPTPKAEAKPAPEPPKENMVATAGNWMVPAGHPLAKSLPLQTDGEGLADFDAVMARTKPLEKSEDVDYDGKDDGEEEDDDEEADDEGVEKADPEKVVDKKEKNVDATEIVKSGFGLEEMQAWLEKSQRPEGLRPETALTVLDSFLAEGDDMEKGDTISGHSTAGQGGFEKVGDPHKDLPKAQCASDGDGDRKLSQQFNGPQDAGMATAASTSGAPAIGFDDIQYEAWPSERDVDFQRVSGGQRFESLTNPGGMIRKSSHLQGSTDWRSRMDAAINAIDTDIHFNGAGIPATELQKSEGGEPPRPSTDELLSKAIEVGGLSIAEASPAGVDFRLPTANLRACGSCGGLTKSYLTSCDQCGTPLGASDTDVVIG